MTKRRVLLAFSVNGGSAARALFMPKQTAQAKPHGARCSAPCLGAQRGRMSAGG
jgi:hypothetical protein